MAIKTADFIKELNGMSVQDLNELVKAIEEEFGVTAAAPVAAGAGAEETGSTEKTLTLTEAGGNKVAVIKIVREVMGLGLMEAKQFVDGAPGVIKENIKPEEADELAAKFTEAGATVTSA